MANSVSLQALLEGQTVASSRLSSQLSTELFNEGLIVPVIRGSRKSYRARNIDALKQYLIDKDESYRIMEVAPEDALSRAVLASTTGNSKLIAIRSCPGFPVNAFEPIVCQLNGKEFIINPANGSFVFVTDWKQFVVPEDVIVVGIENMENFRMIRQQRFLFESSLGEKNFLFVSRYPQSTDLRSWLMTIPNTYVHFGDFDLAGISIFLTEFQKHLGNRAEFFIPTDIESRICTGSIDRYNNQYLRFQNLQTDDKNLQALIDLIKKHHRCFDQEGYIFN